jgi:hypothetical protein
MLNERSWIFSLLVFGTLIFMAGLAWAFIARNRRGWSMQLPQSVRVKIALMILGGAAISLSTAVLLSLNRH